MQADGVLALNLSYQSVRYDETNPIFNERQEDNKWSAFLAYSYQKPFGWEDWELVSLAGYSNSDANIDFYDEKSLLVTAGFSYNF